MSITTCCDATQCKKRNQCAKYIINLPIGTYQSLDFSTMGSGGSNQPTINYCGDNGSYKLFEPIPNTQNPQVSNKGRILFGSEDDLKYMHEMCVKIGISIYDKSGNIKSPYRIIGDIAQSISILSCSI